MEIVASHHPEWRFSPAEAVADFGVHAMLVLGPPLPTDDLAGLVVTLTGPGTTVTGRGADVLGGPAESLRALADLPGALPIGPDEVDHDRHARRAAVGRARAALDRLGGRRTGDDARPHLGPGSTRVCTETADPAAVAFSAPRPAAGPATDPVHLEPVDALTITVLVDNSYDALMTRHRRRDADPPRRPAPGSRRASTSTGSARPGLVAEHGFAAVVTVTRNGARPHAALRHRHLARGHGRQRPRLDVDPGDFARRRPLATATATTPAASPGSTRWLGRARDAPGAAPGGVDPPPARPARRPAVRHAAALPAPPSPATGSRSSSAATRRSCSTAAS